MEIENKQTTDVTVTDQDFFSNVNYGDDFLDYVKVPRLLLINSGSKILKKEDPKYIPGVESGCYINDLSGENFGENPELIFLGQMFRSYTAYGYDPDTNTTVLGDYRGTFTADEIDEGLKTGRYKQDKELSYFLHDTQDENVLLHKTLSYFCVPANNITPTGMMLMSLSRTGLSFITEFNSNARLVMHNGKPVPLYAPVWRLDKLLKKSDNGNTWYIPKLASPTKDNPRKGFVRFVEQEERAAILELNRLAMEYIKNNTRFDLSDEVTDSVSHEAEESF